VGIQGKDLVCGWGCSLAIVYPNQLLIYFI
jgi:hypothetical protein